MSYFINEENIFTFLIQVFLLLGLTRGLGELFRRHKQPPLTAEILVGVLLGPTIFGRFLPWLHQSIFPADTLQQNMLETLSWLGILFLLLETGLEIDFSSAWRQKGDVLKISITGILVPLVIAFAACLFLPDQYLIDPSKRIFFALFMAAVMMTSAMPITARTLHDLSLSKTDLGFLIMSALSVNDIIGWSVFTLVMGLFMQAQVEVIKIIFILVAIMGFSVFCLTLGRRFTNSAISAIKQKHIPEPGASLTFICLLGLLCGAITQRLGIHALFGFFIAGVMAGSAKALSERTRQVILQMVYAIFVPIFFAGIGLKIDFARNFNIFLVVFVTGISIMAKFLGAWLGTMLTRVSKDDRLSIAIAHTPGGAMEIVIAVLALERHFISEPVFVAIVLAAVVSSALLGPWLNYSIRRRKEISVLDFFLRRAVISELKAHDKNGAIFELCQTAAEQENIPEAEILYESVIKRENAMGTAIEESVAVPHARFYLLRKPGIIFGRSLSGIDWDSPDGKQTHFVFLILTPLDDDQVQIQILTLIAKMMSQQTVREAVLRAKNGQEIWDIIQRSLSAKHIIRK